MKRVKRRQGFHGAQLQVIRNAQGQLEEAVWKVGALLQPGYRTDRLLAGESRRVAENEVQANAWKLLTEYYRTGDLEPSGISTT